MGGYLRVVRTRKWEIALIVLPILVMVIFFTARMTPMYASESTVLVKGVPTPGSLSGAPQQPDLPTEQALILQSSSGKRLGYFPAVAHLDQTLLQQLDLLDVLLFDGTFWTDDELIELQNGGQTARQMGHIPVSSLGGSLDLLSKLPRPRKIFVHINNTNPMLDGTGLEYRQVCEHGWEIAEDGCHLEL